MDPIPGMITGHAADRRVFFGTKEIDPQRSLKLVNHSPDGFSWGYGGSGPAQLALAILLEYFNDDEMALAHYQQFKWAHIALLDGDKDFQIDIGVLDRFAQNCEGHGKYAV